jgi:hypothetical protein
MLQHTNRPDCHNIYIVIRGRKKRSKTENPKIKRREHKQRGRLLIVVTGIDAFKKLKIM